MIVHNTIKKINGRTYVVRQCDCCSNQTEVRLDNILSNRKKHAGIDFCWGCANRNRSVPNGVNHKNWKHGKTTQGHKRINLNGQRVLEHIAVIQEKIGRSLNQTELVHHIDLDKLNNSPSNLWVFPNQTEHNLCHHSLQTCGFQLLGKEIWFNYESKNYQLETYPVPKFEPIECPFKLHEKTDKRCGITYLFYNEKDTQGKWNWRRHHIFVAEQMLKRKLEKKEVVHHIDNNPKNNEPHNLVVMTNSSHRKLHHSIEKLALKCGVVFTFGRYMVT